MSNVRNCFAVALVIFWLCTPASAENTTVSVGAVTRYSGIAGRQQDIQSINEFLNVLESQIAREFINHGDVDYIDRLNTDQIFQELHLSSGSEFNTSSGALKGLLGRLDFLIVIDSSVPNEARVRLIDIESGSVKAIESCNRKASFWGLGQTVPPDCVVPFVNRVREIARQKLAEKIARLKQEEAQAQAGKEKAAAEEKARLQDQQRAQKIAREQAEAEAEKRANEERIAQKQAEARAKDQAELDRRIADLRPTLDELVDRFSADNDFWRGLSQQLASSGLSLHTDVQTALNRANSEMRRCHDLLTQKNVDGLSNCISKLSTDVEQLEKMK